MYSSEALSHQSRASPCFELRYLAWNFIPTEIRDAYSSRESCGIYAFRI
ncbi:hypothetical protein HanXRQr2_Chr10g0456041 [Helianthus annuus]|uniref:Uncharacterized protein n=1 Tax=Helianthus annuus TaxID=4232 RepID=A0A9K3I079_HELAN|nr:hypothetical protein HanXRQr2_Chr10g0456041 [Helianthus annuus]KAJ0885011.1 hypothetical protein HanPSC8_Chr10g0440461 [Helianthus annuus]